VTDSIPGFLAWARNDSYVIAGGEEWGSVRIKNVIVDDSDVLTADASCHACGAWDSVQVAFDLDRGFALVKGEGFGWKIGDLFVTTATSSDDANAEVSDNDDPLAKIRTAYDANYPALPKIWSLGERLTLSHTEDDGSDNARTQAKFLIQHTRQAATTIVASQTANAQLIGRAIRGGPVSIEEIKNQTQSNLAFYSLGQFGIKTQALAELASYVDTSPNNGSSKTRELNAALADIHALVPASGPLFGKGNFDNNCGMQTKPDTAFLVDPDNILKIWRWRGATGGRWIVQSSYSEGSGAFPNGCVIVFRESSSRPVSLMDSDLLGIETASGQGIDVDVFRVTDSIIAIASRVTNRINGIRLFEVESGNTIGALMPIADGPMLSELRLTRDAKHLVQLNKDGRFYVRRVADGKAELQGAYVDNEIVVMTDDGRYDTSYEGAESVQLHFDGIPGLFAVNQFEALLRRNGLAKDVLNDSSVESRSGTVLAPPAVQLTLSANANGGQRSGKVVANSSRGLSAIHVHVDGRLVSSIPVSGQHAEVPVSLPDPGGGRWVSAIAVDDQGLVSLPSTIHLPGAVRPRGVARVIAIGVDAYADRTIPKLESTKLDAGHFARAIATTQGRAFASVQTSVLLDTDVTRDSVLNAVKAAVADTTEDDTLIFFFAGHGVDGAQVDQPNAGLVLTTNRTMVSDLANTSVPWTVLAGLLNASKGTVVVVLDACQSGIAGREAFSTNDDVVSALFTKSGAPLVVLAASKGRQQSQEVANGGGGRFTNAIVAAITGERASYDSDRSGLIDLGELYSGVKARVERDTQNAQTPWLARNRLVGEISLF
jgi:hypothetical protein